MFQEHGVAKKQTGTSLPNAHNSLAHQLN